MNRIAVNSIGFTAVIALALAAVVAERRDHRVWPAYQEHKQPGSRPGAPYERQQFHLAKRLAPGQTRLAMDAYRPAIAHRKSMRVQRATKSAPGWEWLGPGNIGGRTRALVFHPENPRVVFAAGVSGGIWKSTNGGSSWSPIADELANVNVGALAVSADAPEVIFAGTGELYRHTLRPYSSMTGAGIFRTRDGGQTWVQLAPTINDDFLYVSDIVISPTDPDRLYAATNTGIWRSDNAGVTFVQSLDPSAGGDAEFEGCTDLALRTDRSTDYVLASCASRSTDDRYYLPGLLPDACGGRPCPARVYVNADAANGGDWDVVLTEPGMGRTQLSIHAADQDIVYASSASIVAGPDADGNGTGDYDNGLHAVFRSDDGGRTWRATVRNSDPELLNTTLFSYADGFMAAACDYDPFIYSAGWYNHAIAVSPVDPDVVWVAGMEMYRSDDGGRNWGLGSFWDGFRDGVPSSYLHADVHGIHYHPDYDGTDNKTMFVTNDGGVYQTLDDTRPVVRGSAAPCSPRSDGVQWRSLNANYGVTQFYTGAVSADGNKYIGGTQDNGTLIARSFTGPNAWESILGGDGSHLAIHPTNSQILYASYQNANILRSANNGQSWGRADIGLNDRFIFIAPFVLDPNEPDRLWAGGSRIWRSDNAGRAWQTVTGQLGATYDDLISAIAVSTGPENRVVVGNRKGIFVAEGALGADIVSRRVESAPRSGWVSSLKFDPSDESTIYATYSTFGGHHVWRSRDAGRSWSAIDGNGIGRLPDIPVHTLAIHPDDPDTLFVGTDIGVFSSADGGESWAVENAGFANAIVETLAVSTEGTPALFAFTYGRGVWKAPLDGLDGRAAYAIDGTTSGLWYNPDQGGHGLQIEVLADDRIFVSWYAYRDAAPMWLSGVGTISGDRARADLVTATGGGLPPNFDADAVRREPWGVLDLQFRGNNAGTISWSSARPGYADGKLPIVRLSQLATSNPPTGLLACHSGTWFSSDQSGHGFMLQVLEGGTSGRVALTWFLSDAAGEPLWLLGQGDLRSGGADVELARFTGADFPPKFDPVDVRRETWGQLTLDVVDDNQLQVDWQAVAADASSGSLPLERLTYVEGLGCD